MKLTNLFKKAATVLCALALVGMLAACSNGSSSSSNSNGNGGGSDNPYGSYEYAIMYDDILIFGTDSNGYNSIKSKLTVGKYTESDKTLKLKDEGFDELLTLPMLKKNPNDVYVAIVAYAKICYGPLTQADYDLAASELTEVTDYNITHDGRVIELTYAGLKKGEALFGEDF